MITLLIGHRGSGKTSLLKRLETYHSETNPSARTDAAFIDLDQTIQEREGRTIAEIFASDGEKKFRDLERTILRELCRERAQATGPTFIALGAGFEGPLPKGTRCVRIRRPTDSAGRIFLDTSARPRLEQGMSPLEEFRKRAQTRESRYDAWADEEWCVTEGFEFPHDEESFFFDFDSTPRQVGGTVTLLPSVAEDPERLKNYLSRRRNWGVRFEIRDDLLDERTQAQLLTSLPADRVIFSIRRSRGSMNQLKPSVIWDWALELGDAPRERVPSIISLHDRGNGSVTDAIRRLEASAPSRETWLKLAVPIRDFNELWECHEWALRDPRRRAFLPRTPEGETGRWGWYRLLTGRRMPLAFFRDFGPGSAIDQPPLSDWLRFGTLWNSNSGEMTFAAILGDPVVHSRTPGEQWRFFADRKMPVLSVRVTEDEWRAGALEILRKLGLRSAAVTSPLKLLAFFSSSERTECARDFESVNTLHWSEARGWCGHNTDIDGLHALFAEAGLDPKLDASATAVWGGGGTLPLLESLLPDAYFFSARSGTERNGKPMKESPRFLIWGLGRSRQEQAAWPRPDWKPECVVDLNYSDDSPGREFALARGSRYVSGLSMFTAQAAAQRKFWESN